jgi:hypothetical protein
MLTKRHESRLWNPHLFKLFPGLSSTKIVRANLMRLNSSLEVIRLLRNRVAHHEPVFSRNLAEDFTRIHYVINARCRVTAGWMMAQQQALAVIKARPF